MSTQTPYDASRIPASVGQATCGIIHDLANLMQTIILRAEVTSATEPVSAACVKRMEQVVSDGQLGANLMRGLLEYARKSVDGLPTSDIRQIVAGAAKTLEASAHIGVAVTLPEAALTARVDHAQLEDMVTLILGELSREADPSATYSLALAPTQPGSDAYNWMSDGAWVQMKFARDGKGGQVELEEGHLQKAATGAAPDEKVFNLMRIRGIVRQHRGQVRVIEEVEDVKQLYIIEVYLPLVT